MAQPVISLTDAKRIAILESIAQQEDLKATARLRALEELGRIEARLTAQAAPRGGGDELPPDPMADLEQEEDELEARRRKRRGRAGRT